MDTHLGAFIGCLLCAETGASGTRKIIRKRQICGVLTSNKLMHLQIQELHVYARIYIGLHQ